MHTPEYITARELAQSATLGEAARVSFSPFANRWAGTTAPSGMWTPRRYLTLCRNLAPPQRHSPEFEEPADGRRLPAASACRDASGRAASPRGFQMSWTTSTFREPQSREGGLHGAIGSPS